MGKQLWILIQIKFYLTMSYGRAYEIFFFFFFEVKNPQRNTDLRKTTQRNLQKFWIREIFLFNYLFVCSNLLYMTAAFDLGSPTLVQRFSHHHTHTTPTPHPQRCFCCCMWGENNEFEKRRSFGKESPPEKSPCNIEVNKAKADLRF